MSANDATRAVDFKVLQISCDDIVENGALPTKFSGDGENINPSFSVQHIPQEAKSLVLVMLDENEKVYWVIWNIPVTHHIRENETHGIIGVNSFGHQHYDGPLNELSGLSYTVKVYALKSVLNITSGISLPELERFMSDEIIAFGSFDFKN